MKLKCLGDYRNDARGLVYQKGTVFEATEEEAAFLMSDAPGCFEVYQKRVRKPPKDKMLREAGGEK